jgi:hypothetical protein
MLIPLLVLLVVVATDLRVYIDAKRCAGAGSPVFLRFGRFSIETPIAWLVGCIIFWIFFPMYLASRSPWECSDQLAAFPAEVGAFGGVLSGVDRRVVLLLRVGAAADSA